MEHDRSFVHHTLLRCIKTVYAIAGAPTKNEMAETKSELSPFIKLLFISILEFYTFTLINYQFHLMKTVSTLFSLAAILFVFACGNKQQHDDHEATAKDSVWRGMDEFHLVMAESFHPYKDSSNLEPAKKFAHEMDSVAGVWIESARPEKVNTDEVKAKLDKLKADTKLFAEAVKVEADSTLAKSLIDLHNQFHALQEAWYSDHTEHGDHH